jgi:hypothetical protein|nr:MAG TPA: Nitrile hydratase beta subunit [Caudoviricetes sp.]
MSANKFKVGDKVRVHIAMVSQWSTHRSKSRILGKSSHER